MFNVMISILFVEISSSLEKCKMCSARILDDLKSSNIVQAILPPYHNGPYESYQALLIDDHLSFCDFNRNTNIYISRTVAC